MSSYMENVTDAGDISPKHLLTGTLHDNMSNLDEGSKGFFGMQNNGNKDPTTGTRLFSHSKLPMCTSV